MKRRIIGVCFLIVLIVFILIGINLYSSKKEKERIQKEKENALQEQIRKENKINDINSHYGKYVKTNKETILYQLENEEYQEFGKVNQEIDFELEEMKIDENTDYFQIKDLNYYVKYEDVDKVEQLDRNNRYKRYIPFNENVVTENKTVFYNDLGYVYGLSKGIELPLIIKENDKYYVEYNNSLLFIKKEDAVLKKAKNTEDKTRNNIRTFTYHAVYKPGETCKNKAICHPYEQFDSQMKYLSENNYLTLTMEELEMFLDKKINIPMKTVVITLDDGNLAKNAIEILEKYKLYATYFIITGRYDSYKLESNYVNFESHTDNLHNNYKCSGGVQGGQLLCEDKNKVLADLAISQEKLGGSKYLAYPFFDWNTRAFTLLKESGFHLAFIGQYDSEGYSTYTTNRFMIRRKTIFASDSLETFKSYLK